MVVWSAWGEPERAIRATQTKTWPERGGHTKNTKNANSKQQITSRFDSGSGKYKTTYKTIYKTTRSPYCFLEMMRRVFGKEINDILFLKNRGASFSRNNRDF